MLAQDDSAVGAWLSDCYKERMAFYKRNFDQDLYYLKRCSCCGGSGLVPEAKFYP